MAAMRLSAENGSVSVPTCEQLDNARRLADTLDKVAAEWPEHFDMRRWVYGTPGNEVSHMQGGHPAECGTTGCALGWAPYALGEPIDNESWEKYAERLFGLDRHGWWFNHLFMSYTLFSESGVDAARAAADRLREYVAAHEGDCTDG